MESLKPMTQSAGVLSLPDLHVEQQGAGNCRAGVRGERGVSRGELHCLHLVCIWQAFRVRVRDATSHCCQSAL